MVGVTMTVRTGELRVGTTVELLVLAARGHTLAAVDLHCGGLTWVTYPPDAPTAVLRPFDVIRAVAGPEPAADPSRPDTIALAATPDVIGRLRGRRAERLLRPLLHPDEHLLGFAGPAIPFWTLTGDRPSLAVVEPKGPVIVRGDDDGLHCRFEWRGLSHELPFTDLRAKVASAARQHGGIRVDRRLLVALTPPYLGHCYKVVAALLPR